MSFLRYLVKTGATFAFISVYSSLAKTPSDAIYILGLAVIWGSDIVGCFKTIKTTMKGEWDE